MRLRKLLERIRKPLERTPENVFLRAFIPQLMRSGIVIALQVGVLAAAVLELKDENVAWAVPIGAGAGTVLGGLIAWGLARSHKLVTHPINGERNDVLPRLNIAAAECGYVIASEVGNDYIRYEDVETPAVGARGIIVPGLNVVIQFSNNSATITGPKWIVARLVATSRGDARGLRGLSEQDISNA